MAATGSRFGLNLLLQFVLASLLGGMGASLRGPFGALLSSTGQLVYASFAFGVLYGFFRLLGVKGGALEQFYQNFPMGFMTMDTSAAPTAVGTSVPVSSSIRSESSAGGEGTPSSAQDWQTTSVVSAPSSSFDWDDLFSVKYLRYMGLLLILSAAFSMLFRLEWNTTQKLVASLISAIACLAGAEFFKRRHVPALASGLFLPGFACLQFCLTLGYLLLVQDDPGAVSAPLWLGVKLVVTIGCLPLLSRYSADFTDPIYFIVAFISPIALETFGGAAVGGGVGVVPLIIFLFALSAVACGWAVMRERVDVLMVALLLAFILTFSAVIPRHIYATSGSQGSFAEHAYEVFLFTIALFVLHLGSAAALHLSNGQRWAGLLSAHAVLTHILAGAGAGSAQDWIPELKGYLGVTLVGMSLLTFAAHLFLRSKEVRTAYSETLCQLAMAVSAIGLFLQVEGTWTAIAFLVYSCITLWLSIHYSSKTTRIYAFLMLTVSVFKLYATSSELFDSLSGSSVILIIGVVLMGLATRLERLKRSEAGGEPK